MKIPAKLFACALLLLPVYPAAAAPVAENPSFIPVMTRLVKLFIDLETRLDSALRQANRDTLDELVLGDFEQRIGTQPGDPIPREDWLQAYSASSKAIPALVIEQMAARDLGDTVVVSFKWAGRNSAQGFFIVDIWQRESERYKLAARYADPIQASKTAVPGTPTAPWVLPKKF